MFSPTYFGARRRDPATPAETVCAVNAVLYRPGGGAWAFTEARPGSVERSEHSFAASGSRIERSSDALTVHLDERTAPWGRRLQGRVRIDLHAGAPTPLSLDRAGAHHWWPVGARATAHVELTSPSIRFCGSAYHDCNFGRIPLEDSFASWNWSRADVGDDVCIIYDVDEHHGDAQPLGLRIGPSSGVETLRAPVITDLPRGGWGVPRSARAHADARLVRTLEDSPFYTRSLLHTQFDGRPVIAVHESLSMTRFVRPWVQFLLPFRIRRGWRA